MFLLNHQSYTNRLNRDPSAPEGTIIPGAMSVHSSGTFHVRVGAHNVTMNDYQEIADIVWLIEVTVFFSVCRCRNYHANYYEDDMKCRCHYHANY